MEVLYGPGYPSQLDSGTKGVTRWKESHKRRLSAPRAARGASIEPLEVPAGWGAGRTDEHGMQRNQEVKVSNRSVDDNVIVIGGGARVSSVPERSPKVNSGSPSSNRELVGGECSYWACIPSKALLRPGEAVHRARGAAANARVDIEPALAWRDFMVNDYFDAGQERWLEDRGIGLLRGSGRVAGPGVVEVDGVRHTAIHVLSRPARIYSCRPGPARGVERHHSAVSVFSVDLRRNTETTPLCRQLVYRAAGWLQHPNDIRAECELGAASRR